MDQHSYCHQGRCIDGGAQKLSPVLITKLQPPTSLQTWSMSRAVSFCCSAPAAAPSACT